MEKKFYTVILVPHAKAQFKKLKISYSLMVVATVLVVGLAAGLVGLGLRFSAVHGQASEVSRLRQENFQLKRENSRTRETTEQIQAQLTGFEETVNKFKLVFGAETESESGVGEMSLGTEPAVDDPSLKYNGFSYLARLKSQAESVKIDLEAMKGDLDAKAVVITHTPTIRPVKTGFISSTFGSRIDPFTGKRAVHNAVDISCWYWTEIHAPADGVVVRAEKSKGSGVFIEISHGYGYTTLYAHLKKLNVQPGQAVKRFDVLGYVGNTGRSTGPHLHYEVRYEGKPVNPMKFMMDAEELL